MSDAFAALSHAIADRVAATAAALVSLHPGARAERSAMLWQDGVLVTAEQGLPDKTEVPAVLPGGATATATVAGRDPGTNVAVLRLTLSGPATPPVADPVVGGMVLALGAAAGGPTARLGLVHRVGPAWDSMAHGRIDRLVVLDIRLSGREEGGPVLDASGGLLGMSTLGPRRRVLVIPAATIARVVPQLLAGGRVPRGWLGLGLQPVGIPESLRGAAGREAGLMVVSLAPGGPAEQAGMLPGDIVLDVADAPAPHPRVVARVLSGEQVGKPVPVRLLRAGTPITVSPTVAVRPAA